jgi:hypothetical protein
MIKFFTSISLLFFSLVTFAGLDQDYLDLKDRGRNLQDTGAICEEVAILEKQREYGNQYTVISGIEYGDRYRTIGELDLIIFENRTNTAVLIGEVKCWKNMAAGLRKAKDQRQRFLQNVHSGKELFFRWKDNPQVRFTKQQLNKAERFISVAQRGSIAVGYDLELEHSLSELMQLRDKIMQCQTAGLCKKPKH